MKQLCFSSGDVKPLVCSRGSQQNARLARGQVSVPTVCPKDGKWSSFPPALSMFESSESLAVALPSPLLPPSVLAQEVCLGVGGTGKKQRKLFSAGLRNLHGLSRTCCQTLATSFSACCLSQNHSLVEV